VELRDDAEKHLRVRLRPYFHDPTDAERLVLDIPDHRLERFGELGTRIRDVLGAWDLRPGLSRFRGPALVVTGPASVFPPEAMDELADVLPNGSLVHLPRTGHFPFLEDPEGFREAVATRL
jgi:proline iminopeptidase